MFVVPPLDPSPAIVAPIPTLLHPRGALSLLVAVSPRGECRTQLRLSPLRSPLLSTVGVSSYYLLWQDVDLAVAVFQAAKRRAATGTAFDVSAALRDALCRGIVSRFSRRPPVDPARLYALWVATPRTGAALPSPPPSL